MPIYIKTGLWENSTTAQVPKGWLNLTKLIKDNSGGASDYTPENSVNKSTSVTTDSTSNTKYPSVKAVFDWANSLFTTTSAVASQITTALAGYATQSFVNTGLANKQDKLQDTTGNIGVGKKDASATEKLDVNGNVKATGFKTPNGTANQGLKANGDVFDLNTKADLVGGKVPKAQSQPSTMVMDNSTYVITFTDATGAAQTIDLPLESLFKDANYNAATKSLIVTLQDGTTRTIPLTDLVDLPEIVLATSNPAVTPTTGQKVYFNTSLGKVWFNVSGAWVFAGNLISDSEKTNLSNAYIHSQATGNPHNTTKADIGLGNVDNTSDLNKPISNATQTALNLKENSSNKVTDFTSPNNTTFPTTQAIINENKKATITVELINLLTTSFYAPNALRINSTALINGSGTIALKVNDVAYTLGNLIAQGAKITVETTTASVYNLIVIYE